LFRAGPIPGVSPFKVVLRPQSIGPLDLLALLWSAPLPATVTIPFPSTSPEILLAFEIGTSR
jgi:hypothetical protein